MTTFVVPEPYETAETLPCVGPLTGTVAPRLPNDGVLLFDPEEEEEDEECSVDDPLDEELLEPEEWLPPPCPPPPRGSRGSKLRAMRLKAEENAWSLSERTGTYILLDGFKQTGPRVLKEDRGIYIWMCGP